MEVAKKSTKKKLTIGPATAAKRVRGMKQKTSVDCGSRANRRTEAKAVREKKKKSTLGTEAQVLGTEAETNKIKKRKVKKGATLQELKEILDEIPSNGDVAGGLGLAGEGQHEQDEG